MRLVDRLRKLGKPGKAKQAQRFFKTGPGEYGEGDVFLGVSMPVLRQVLRKEQSSMSAAEAIELASSELHECRMLGLLWFVHRYDEASKEEEEEEGAATTEAVYKQFVEQCMPHANNWDLVDASVPGVVGRHLLHKRTPEEALEQILTWQQQQPGGDSSPSSSSVWTRRVSVLATLPFIRESKFEPILRVAELTLANNEQHDLIHKAVGWMLREMGKRDESALVAFLDRFAADMPRVMLRYSLERLDAEQRQDYMQKRKRLKEDEEDE